MDHKDLIGGVLLMGLGLFAALMAPSYGIGTATQMGAGYFPMVLGVAAIGLGAAIAVPAFWRARGEDIGIAWRPLVAVCAALLAFGLVSMRFGYVPAIAIATALAALGDARSTVKGTVLLAIAVPIAVWIVFGFGLHISPRAWIGG